MGREPGEIRQEADSDYIAEHPSAITENRTRMKILHAISSISPTSGGPAMALASLARAQRQAGMSPVIAFTWVDQPAAERVQELASEGIEIHGLGPCRDPLSRHSNLVPWIEALVQSADVVHIHALWESIQYHAAAAASRRAVPYLISPHGMLDRWNMSNGWLKKRLYMRFRVNRLLRRSTGIHFATLQEQAWTIDAPLPSRQIIEPFGIDFAEFDNLPPAGAFRQECAQVSDRPFVLFLGRVDRGKGWEYLIPAFACATNSHALRDWILVVAGPDYFGNLGKARELAHRQGIADRVIFTGMLSARQRLAALRDCELVALPSCHENFGIAVAEAMAAAKPVIVSDQVALHHQVGEWRAGDVTPLVHDRISASLERWMRDPVLRREAGRHGTEMARKHFNWNDIALRWARHYQDIVSKNGQANPSFRRF